MNDLELLREIFKDSRLHVGIGTILELGISNDKSKLRVKVNLLPENREIIALMTFADAFTVTFPEVDDLALVLFVDGHDDDAWVVKVCNDADEPIPTYALSGNTMIAPRSGKKVGIGRSTVTPTEPLVLGNVLKTALQALIDSLLKPGGTAGNPIGQSAMGSVYLDPGVRTALTTFQSTYLDTTSTNILSQLGFTERGA